MPQALLHGRHDSPIALGAGALLVLLVSAWTYAQYGFNGELVRDDAIYLYSGQQIARGVPPYVSIFDHKGPVAPLIAGLGAYASKLTGVDDVLGVRGTFFVISALAVVAIYLLGTELNNSHLAGFLAAFTFLGFWGFGRHAASGPRAKAPMVLLAVLALWLMARKKWFWAGLCGVLAALTWQPAAIYPAIVALLALLQPGNGGGRLRNVLWVGAGLLVPVVGIGAYFAYHGALYELVDGTVLFNLLYLDRGVNRALPAQIAWISRAVRGGYAGTFMSIVVGLAALAVAYAWRLVLYRGSVRRWLAHDPLAGTLLSLPLPLAWSLIDFQGYPDFYWVLPYAALGFGWLSYQAARGFVTVEGVTPALGTLLPLVLCLALIAGAAWNYHLTGAEDRRLVAQREWVQEVIAQYGQEVRVASIGVPEALALLHRTNPNPYLFLINGIDNRVQARTPGGFASWLEGLERYDPEVVLYGSTRGQYAPQVGEWLDRGYQRTTIGGWTAYVKRELVP